MSAKVVTPGTLATTPGALPKTPSLEAWRAMTPAQREDFLVMANEATSYLRITGMMGDLEAKAQEADARAQEADARAEQVLAGGREALLAFLDARRVPLSEQALSRVRSCSDTLQLQRWLVRAATAATADEIFADDPAAPRG